MPVRRGCLNLFTWQPCGQEVTEKLLKTNGGQLQLDVLPRPRLSTEVTDDITEMDEARRSFFRQITVQQIFSTAVME